MADEKSADVTHGNRPWAGYDQSTVGEILAKAALLNDAGRERILTYERANKNRKGIVEALVNWNS